MHDEQSRVAKTAARSARLLVFASFALVGGSTGCILGHEGATDVEVEDGTLMMSWEEYQQAASENTFVKEDGTVLYNVEWDSWVTEQQLRDMYEAAQAAGDEIVDKAHAFQRVITGFIPAFPFPNSVDIKYCVSNDFGTTKSTWATAVYEATQDWEKAANVRFRYLGDQDGNCSSETAAVDFAVVRLDDVGGYCGANKMGWGIGCLAGFGVVQIDTKQDPKFGGRAPNLTPRDAMRHELGHVLGLRHEHPWRPTIDPKCPETPDLPFTDTTGVQLVDNVPYDQLSVMHYPYADCGGVLTSHMFITANDSNSVQRLYGMQPGVVSAIL